MTLGDYDTTTLRHHCTATRLLRDYTIDATRAIHTINAIHTTYLSYLALPCLALPCLAVPCLALPCLSLLSLLHYYTATLLHATLGYYDARRLRHDYTATSLHCYTATTRLHYRLLLLLLLLPCLALPCLDPCLSRRRR